MNTPVQNYPDDAPPRQPKTWFGRNAKWFIPVLVVSAVLAVALFVGGILEFAHALMSSSEAYKTAVQRAEDSPALAERIGRPMHVGWFTAGSIHLNNDSGDAELSIRISGPRGNGRILVAAKKEHGRWSYQTMEVDVDGDHTAIPLLHSGEGAPAPKDNPSGIT
jgi:hypothetical protein